MMPKLTILRGLPGSGKTHWARQQPGAVCVSRDGFRDRFNGDWDYTDKKMEDLITILQFDMIDELLVRGFHVIVDDCNLQWRHVTLLVDLANRAAGRKGVGVIEVVVKEFLHVPLETCIERDATRSGAAHVGEDKIRAMYAEYLGGAT